MYDFIYVTGSSLPELETAVETYFDSGYTPVGSVVSDSGTYIQGMQNSVVNLNVELPDPEGNNKNLLSRVWRMRHMDIGFVTSSQLSTDELTSLGI